MALPNLPLRGAPPLMHHARMQVETAALATLLPYEFNNRQHGPEQVARIARSIEEFGFNQPIVVDENSVILVGHGRLFAAQRLGLKEAPVVRLTGLNETQKKAYRVLDNKLQNDSTWDFDNVGLELGFLEDNGFDLAAWGLDDLRALIDPPGAGGDYPAGPTLTDRFVVPPFSVLDARQGYWQDRKRHWLSIGILSELGRGDGAAVGGSPMPNGKKDKRGRLRRDAPDDSLRMKV